MPSRISRLPLVVVLGAVGLVAGCGGDVDLAKATFQRTTVPAAGGPATGTPRTNDAAFASDKLRLIDPCELLDDDTLAKVGEPARSEPSDFSRCSNYMKDADGKDLNLTLTVGETLIEDPSKADQNIGGLPAIEQELDDGSACFLTAVTETSPNRGIKVQVGGDADDLCRPGRTVLEAVIDRVRKDPPKLDPDPASLVTADPCTIGDDTVMGTALGADPTKKPTSLHWCDWTAGSAYVWVWFRVGVDPKDAGDAAKATQVKLSGSVTGYQVLETSRTACKVEWAHRPANQGLAEVVTVAFNRSSRQQGEDLCAKAQTVAKSVLARLPAG